MRACPTAVSELGEGGSKLGVLFMHSKGSGALVAVDPCILATIRLARFCRCRRRLPAARCAWHAVGAGRQGGASGNGSQGRGVVGRIECVVYWYSI
jgi:hypothetical protein